MKATGCSQARKKSLMTHATTPDAIMQLGCPYSAAKTLLGSVESRLLAELAKGPLALDDDRSRIGLHEGGARRQSRRNGRARHAPRARPSVCGRVDFVVSPTRSYG